MASSSSIIDDFDKDDVFLSFRGVDTRFNFTSHLWDALCRNNIKVFIDYNIDRGDEIAPALERAIEGARISIIVFSPDYASSGSCLHELVKIMECRESKAQIVLPIFYKVEPSEATYQEAIDRHTAKSKAKKGRREETMEEELKKVKKWKSALCKALELAGWHIKEDSDEVKVIEEIIKTILEKLETSQSVGEKLLCTSIIGQTAEDSFRLVWEWLMKDNISRVGIYGMGGVGKTTIATRINDELLDSNAFTHVFWVTVSKDLNIVKLQNEIAKTINLDLSKEDDERKRAAKLRNMLKIKKFVLILDDLWEAIKLEEVGIPSLVSGQKILLTSRNRGVCEGMECKSIEVKPLSEHEALDLFMKESKYEMNDSLEWKVIVRSIVKKCAGLPLAIVVVARRMTGVLQIWKWRNTLQELEEPCEGENQDVEKNVFRSLKFSYDRLSNDKFRRCFLYCSLFPEDYLFDRNDLITDLIGEGIVNESKTRRAELDKGNCMIDELLGASLLQCQVTHYGKDAIKMHDVIRDMAHIVLKENSKADGVKAQSIKGKMERCVNLGSVWSHSEFERWSNPKNCSSLTNLSLEWYNREELPCHYFDNMQNLVILKICGLCGLKLVPASINGLVNLRVLILGFYLKLAPSLALAGLKNLWHLELLRISEKFPEGIEELINLKVLKFSFYSASRFQSPVFLKNLSQLQELQIDFSTEVETELLSSLKKLEILKISFESLRSLNSYVKSGYWKGLKEYHIFYSPDGGGIAEEFVRDAEYKRKMHIRRGLNFQGDNVEDMIFPNNIEHLTVDGMDGRIINAVRNNIFDNTIRSLHIEMSERIKHVFTYAFVQGALLNLEKLVIFFGYRVEEMILAEEELVGDEINNYTTIHLPKLKFLKLRWCNYLRSIYKRRMLCPSLQRIEIDDCGKLKRLPFYMEEEDEEAQRRKIQLTVIRMPEGWWDSLHWDHPNHKSIYQFHDLDESSPEDESVDLTLKL